MGSENSETSMLKEQLKHNNTNQIMTNCVDATVLKLLRFRDQDTKCQQF
jgi:hypothetical protein